MTSVRLFLTGFMSWWARESLCSLSVLFMLILVSVFPSFSFFLFLFLYFFFFGGGEVYDDGVIEVGGVENDGFCEDEMGFEF